MIIHNDKFANIKIKALVFEDTNYELYRTVSDATLFVVTQKLYKRWVEDKLLFAADPFVSIEYDGTIYSYAVSAKKYEITPIKLGNPLCDRRSATNFVFAMKQMRRFIDISLYDGIYYEEYGYVLPTYTETVASDDATIGRYLSGGKTAHFSDADFSTLFLDDFAYKDISKITNIERAIQTHKESVSVKQGIATEKFTLPGRPELEKFFNEHIIDILNEPERYKRLGIDFPSSIILYGPPGCGKTYAVEKLIDYLRLPRFDINSSSIASPYIHDTSKKIAEVFKCAIDSAPSVVVIDEMESYLSNRDSQSSNSQHYEEVAEFLRQIQEAQKNKVLIIAMTNMYDKIDPAILRRGRFDHHLEVGLPSEEEITALLSSITQNISLANNIVLLDIAKRLSGKTLADVAFVIKEAGLISGKNGDSEITLKSINVAIDSLPKERTKRRIGFGTD